ncbi:hypothetical protein [Flavobacterium psychrophilum]|uniref:hypothetical protein n=1 Tax=Flavobacterium psychrophilum TaxID=96345 RepID=UPI00164B161A|nr:hypothetical protein [Flavobacterium psychrophilum]EKT4508741.1 hypothetical protein [Flavobacterium psychrophilum]
MKKFGFLAILGLVLLSSISVDAKVPPRGWNYIEAGHLFVWYNGGYSDMGSYHS